MATKYRKRGEVDGFTLPPIDNEGRMILPVCPVCGDTPEVREAPHNTGQIRVACPNTYDLWADADTPQEAGRDWKRLVARVREAMQIRGNISRPHGRPVE